MPYTNRNYGDLFTIWDRLFGTFIELPPSEIRFGLDTHMNERTSGDYPGIMAMPFRRRGPKIRKAA
jgi:sterol desaturase/sphingolipid hydroxylase (fatty acid hydroxylase superfamily)